MLHAMMVTTKNRDIYYFTIIKLKKTNINNIDIDFNLS